MSQFMLKATRSPGAWLRVSLSVALVPVAFWLIPPAVAETRSDVPPHVVGVLVLPGDHPWGVYYEPGFSWEWARTEKSQRYRLLVGRNTYVPYFAARGPSEAQSSLRVTIPDGARDMSATYAVERDDSAAARALGVTSTVHLVEVEVNDGRGGRGTHFVITALRVLDATKEVPWALTDQLLALRERFNAARAAHRAGLQVMLNKAKGKLRAEPGGTILRDLEQTELVIYRPSWRVDSRLLEVFFAYKQQGGFWIKTKRSSRNPHVKYEPPPPERGVSYSAGMGARYVVDASGRIVTEESFPPASFHDVPWQQRVTAGPTDEPSSEELGAVEVVVQANRGTLRAGEPITFTIHATNHSAEPVWTNPSIICTGSWDIIFRNEDGGRLRVDDRDAMGCPSGGILGTRIAPGASATLDVSWDGRLRPQVGDARAAPPGKYEIEATVRWADQEKTPNFRGRHTFTGSARTVVVVK